MSLSALFVLKNVFCLSLNLIFAVSRKYNAASLWVVFHEILQTYLAEEAFWLFTGKSLPSDEGMIVCFRGVLRMKIDTCFTEALPERQQPVRSIPSQERMQVYVNYPVMIVILFVLLGLFVSFTNPSVSEFLQNAAQHSVGKIVMLLLIPPILLTWLFLYQAMAKRRRITRRWLQRDAECLAWEASKITGGNVSRSSRTLKLLCEYQDGRETVQVTPLFDVMSWASQSGAERFLDSRVNAEGGCKLAVNPENTLEAYLLPYDSRLISMLFFFCMAFSATFAIGVFFFFLR